MVYEKNIWANGDTITAEKLNHMEDGIAEGGSGGGFVFITTDGYWMPLVTLGEIRRIYASGNIPIANYNFGGSQQGGGQHEYELIEKFCDNGSESPAQIIIHGSQYESTSGADDATWHVYE